MEARTRNGLIAATVVLLVFAALSAASSGVIRAITFAIAVIAIVVALALIGSAVVRLVQAGAGRVPSDTEGG